MDPNQEELLNFIGEYQEIAEELTRSIASSHKATIFIRKEQSALVREKKDLKEMLVMAQRDFEMAFTHTKQLI